MKKIIFITFVIILSTVHVFAIGITPFSKLIKQGNPSINQDRDYHMIQVTRESWNTTDWMNSERYEYHYNQSNPAKIDSISIYTYNETEWLKTGVDRISYMPDQMYVTFIERCYLLEGYSMPMMKMFVNYDNQNRLTNIAIYRYIINAWAPLNRMQIDYAENNTFSVFEWYGNDETNPPEYQRGTFDFDTFGRVTQDTWEVSADSSFWEYDNSTNRTYHPNDTSTGAEFIHNIALDLPLSMFSDDEGPSFGMVSEETNYSWTDDGWVAEEHTLYTYMQNWLTESLIQGWLDDAWINTDKETYSHNNDNTLHQIVHQYYGDSDWVNSNRTTYEWSEFTGNHDNQPVMNNFSLSVYPNPFNQNISMKTESRSKAPIFISIYNTKGQLVKSLKSPTGNPITWDGTDLKGHKVSSGIYFCKVTQENHKAFKKIIKFN